VKRFTLFFLLVLLGCSHKKKIEVERSFYYWRSVFHLSQSERNALDSLSVHRLYVKFFDVDWNINSKSAIPITHIQFRTSPPSGFIIIPVIFITNETLQFVPIEQIDILGEQMIKLIQNISIVNSLLPSSEIQIDCDWTANTKEKYFQLLKAIQKQPGTKGKQITSTIRLHQLKFVRQTGIPPVARGLLMCYNMANLYDPEIPNSILDVEELRKYIGALREYPIKLDIALPIFDWYVWFRNSRFKGLIQTSNLDKKISKTEKTVFEKDSMVNGYTFEKGDWIRYENCSASDLKAAARMIRELLQNDSVTVILYHLNEHNLSKYSQHEMEDIFNCFY